MSILAGRTFTQDMASDIKLYIINELLPEFSTEFFGDLLLSFTKSLHTRKLLTSILVKLWKKFSAERILTDPHKTAVLHKMLQLTGAFISNKARLEHFQKPFCSSWLAFGIGRSWCSSVYGSTWYVFQHWAPPGCQPAPGAGIVMATQRGQNDRAKKVFSWWAKKEKLKSKLPTPSQKLNLLLGENIDMWLGENKLTAPRAPKEIFYSCQFWLLQKSVIIQRKSIDTVGSLLIPE